MKDYDLRAQLEAAGFNQSSFARLLGIDARKVRKWVAGDEAIPKWAKLILATSDRVKELDK